MRHAGEKLHDESHGRAARRMRKHEKNLGKTHFSRFPSDFPKTFARASGRLAINRRATHRRCSQMPADTCGQRTNACECLRDTWMRIANFQTRAAVATLP